VLTPTETGWTGQGRKMCCTSRQGTVDRTKQPHTLQ